MVKSLQFAINAALVISIIIGIYLMVNLTTPYLSFKYDVDFLLTKQNILHVKIWRYAFYTHIILSIPLLVLGLIQFIFLLKSVKIHRSLGVIYVCLILLFTAPSALIMAYYANGGFWAKLSFVIASILWWSFTFISLKKAKIRNWQAHINFIIRSYALTLSALTLRLYVLLLPSIIHLPAKEMYVLVAWLSWVPNLIIAEIIISKKLFKVPAFYQKDR